MNGVLLESKADRWHAQRIALVESIQNLAAFYQALQALPRSTSTADLSEWFEHLIDQVGRRCHLHSCWEQTNVTQASGDAAAFRTEDHQHCCVLSTL